MNLVPFSLAGNLTYLSTLRFPCNEIYLGFSSGRWRSGWDLLYFWAVDHLPHVLQYASVSLQRNLSRIFLRQIALRMGICCILGLSTIFLTYFSTLRFPCNEIYLEFSSGRGRSGWGFDVFLRSFACVRFFCNALLAPISPVDGIRRPWLFFLSVPFFLFS